MPGGIDFTHAWTFQIKCMMANQYARLVQALHVESADDVIAVCLRLGWNDAFKHVSENVPDADMLSECDKNGWLDMFAGRKKKVTPGMSGFKIIDTEKDELAYRICKTLVEDFKKYAVLTNAANRAAYIHTCVEKSDFKDKFTPYKKISSSKHPLCFGHVQKMFNMAMKLLLCLIMSREHAVSCGLTVKLGSIGKDDVYLASGALSIENYTHEGKTFAFDSADCPIDSIILKAIDKKTSKKSSDIKKSIEHGNFEGIVWSKLGYTETEGNYEKAQKEIEEIQSGTGKSKLCFDFENWN